MNCTAGWSCKIPATPKKCGQGSYQPLPGQGFFISKFNKCSFKMVIFQITVWLVKRAFIVTQKVWRLRNHAKMVQSASRQDYPNVQFVQVVHFALTQVKGQIFHPHFSSSNLIPTSMSQMSHWFGIGLITHLKEINYGGCDPVDFYCPQGSTVLKTYEGIHFFLKLSIHPTE